MKLLRSNWWVAVGLILMGAILPLLMAAGIYVTGSKYVYNLNKPTNAWYFRVIDCETGKIWDGDSFETSVPWSDSLIRMTDGMTADGVGAWWKEFPVPAKYSGKNFLVPFYDAPVGSETYTDDAEFTYIYTWKFGLLQETSPY